MVLHYRQQKWCHFLKVYIIDNHLLIQTLSTAKINKRMSHIRINNSNQLSVVNTNIPLNN